MLVDAVQGNRIRSRTFSAVLVMVVESYLYYRYAQLDAEFHFWLHGMLGAALGLAVLTGLRLLSHRRGRDGGLRRPGRELAPWEAGWIGHLYSAIPAPLVTMLVVFLLSLTAYWYSLAMSGRTVAAATALAAGAVTFTAALGLAAPISADIEDLRVDRGIALCPVQLRPPLMPRTPTPGTRAVGELPPEMTGRPW